MAWFFLFVAGLFEVAWALGLKYTDGFTRVWPTVGTILAIAISLFLLGLALKHIPLGTGYAVWTGIGTVGTVLVGIALFNEPVNLVRMGCISLILIGIIGLKFSSMS